MKKGIVEPQSRHPQRKRGRKLFDNVNVAVLLEDMSVALIVTRVKVARRETAGTKWGFFLGAKKYKP